MQRALSCCVLAAATAATLHGSAKADELQSTGVEGSFFLFSEQEAAWTQSTPEAARTSVRLGYGCLLYTSPSPRDGLLSRMPSSA